MTSDPLGLPPLVDSHAHLDDPRLYGDLDAVLTRARAVGVIQIMAIGTTAQDSALVADIATQRPGIYAAVGIHPNHAAEATAEDWERVTGLLDREHVLALGETGLDHYRKNTPRAL